MDRSSGDSASFHALRLGLPPQRVTRLRERVTLDRETLVIRSATEQPAPLLLCLHPARMSEFQFAHALRGLTALQVHLAFPRALHAHEVDLGGAQTVGYAWYHYTGDNPDFRASLALAIDYLGRVVDRLLHDLPVDRRALYILGAGEGASMAAVFGASRAEAFSAVIAIGGQLHAELLCEHAGAGRRPHFLWLRGRHERPARAQLARETCAELQAAGIRVDLEWLEQDDAPWHEEESAVISWLSQRIGVPIAERE